MATKKQCDVNYTTSLLIPNIELLITTNSVEVSGRNVAMLLNCCHNISKLPLNLSLRKIDLLDFR